MKNLSSDIRYCKNFSWQHLTDQISCHSTAAAAAVGGWVGGASLELSVNGDQSLQVLVCKVSSYV
eukprot:scaffold3224_cov170-Alexandrium_tamarense.AAC.3